MASFRLRVADTGDDNLPMEDSGEPPPAELSSTSSFSRTPPHLTPASSPTRDDSTIPALFAKHPHLHVSVVDNPRLGILCTSAGTGYNAYVEKCAGKIGTVLKIDESNGTAQFTISVQDDVGRCWIPFAALSFVSDADYILELERRKQKDEGFKNLPFTISYCLWSLCLACAGFSMFCLFLIHYSDELTVCRAFPDEGSCDAADGVPGRCRWAEYYVRGGPNAVECRPVVYSAYIPSIVGLTLFSISQLLVKGMAIAVGFRGGLARLTDGSCFGLLVFCFDLVFVVTILTVAPIYIANRWAVGASWICIILAVLHLLLLIRLKLKTSYY